MSPAGLRIIAGELRGRRIRTLPGGAVRPTSDRVRESIFNILGQHLPGLAVLDVYAGTGALGFEALSRGAATVTFLESDPRVALAIESTARNLRVDNRVRIVVGDAEQALRRRRIAGPFDLVIADPPYSAGDPGGFFAALAGARILAPGARVVFERDSKSAPYPGENSLVLERTVRYGGTAVDFFGWRGGTLP